MELARADARNEPRTAVRGKFRAGPMSSGDGLHLTV